MRTYRHEFICELASKLSVAYPDKATAKKIAKCIVRGTLHFLPVQWRGVLGTSEIILAAENGTVSVCTTTHETKFIKGLTRVDRMLLSA